MEFGGLGWGGGGGGGRLLVEPEDKMASCVSCVVAVYDVCIEALRTRRRRRVCIMLCNLYCHL